MLGQQLLSEHSSNYFVNQHEPHQLDSDAYHLADKQRLLLAAEGAFECDCVPENQSFRKSINYKNPLETSNFKST